MTKKDINTKATEFKIIEDAKDEPTLKAAQEFVGGYVEMVTFPNDAEAGEVSEVARLKFVPSHQKPGRAAPAADPRAKIIPRSPALVKVSEPLTPSPMIGSWNVVFEEDIVVVDPTTSSS